MLKLKKTLALFLALIMCLALVATTLIGCNGGGKDSDTDTDTSSDTDTDTDTSTGTTGKIEYTIRAESQGGLPVEGVTFAIYDGENMKEFGTTDAKGALKVSLEKSNNYVAKVRSAPAGYSYDENGYKMSAAGTKVVLTSSLIQGSSFPTTAIQLGQIMTDFTITDALTNKKVSLSDLFNGPDGVAGTDDDKKMVLINFFFTTCSPCINEIPYMLAAYEKYKDDVAIIGLDSNGDTQEQVKYFAIDMEINFPVAAVNELWSLAIANSSGVSSYPTNLVVDRYGTVTLIEVGGITSQTPFNLMFEFFSADDYKQTLVTELEQITPVETPNVSMPSSDDISAAINSGNIEIEYYPEDDEMAWPFVIEEDESGNKYIVTSNSGKLNSYAQINATVSLKAGEALAFNYFSNTEKNFDGEDIFYIFVDGKDIFTISGVSESWTTCYCFVAEDDGEYEVSLLYLKNDVDDKDPENDGFYIDDMRVVDASEIDEETYISRYAATKPNSDGLGFQKYANIVLGDDGFYHVGTKTGPLLLVELINVTQFARDTSVTVMAYNGLLTTMTTAEVEKLLEYCNYASNSKFYGLCPVTEELKELLIKVTDSVGVDEDPNEWLQMCEYYSAYGTETQIENPIKGLAIFCPFETELSTEENPTSNYVEYIRGIFPRGYLYKYTPEKSGVFRVTTNSSQELIGWIFLDNHDTLYTSTDDRNERLSYLYLDGNPNNCTMIAYFEEGVDYYIALGFYDSTATGNFDFTLTYEAETFNAFVEASPGVFTFEEGENFNPDTLEGIGATIAGGVDVMLYEGYYYVKNKDGSRGSLLYADFLFATNIFKLNLKQIIESGGFDLSRTSSDQEILAYISSFEVQYILDSIKARMIEEMGEAEGTAAFEALNEDNALVPVINGKEEYDDAALLAEIEEYRAKYQANKKTLSIPYFEELWGDSFEESAATFMLYDVLEGKLHGKGEDYTEEASIYIEKMITAETHPDNPELHGCVAVDEDLAALLQILMDKFTFEGVDHSWTKLCYYYLYLGPTVTE